MEEVIVQPKPGILLCNGKYKLLKYDDRNIVIAKKSENSNEFSNVVKDAKTGTIRKYINDGYSPLGNYFGTVESAVMFLLTQRVEKDMIEDEEVKSLEEFLVKLQEITEEFKQELSEYNVKQL